MTVSDTLAPVAFQTTRLINYNVKKNISICSSFLACLITASAQEVVTGLQSNSLIKKNNLIFERKGLNATDTLELPFFDDFSGRSIFPDSKNWIDNFVFINNTYSDKQITAGIATFDALDNSGNMYGSAAPSGFEADKLTSQPINLKYPSSDNIFLSFFYQPGGLSDPPELNDSLTLQFFAPVENTWYSVWKANGSADQKIQTSNNKN